MHSAFSTKHTFTITLVPWPPHPPKRLTPGLKSTFNHTPSDPRMRHFPICLTSYGLPVRMLPAKLHLARPPLHQGPAAAVTIQQHASLHDQTLLIQVAFTCALEVHCVAVSSVTLPVIAFGTCDKSPCCLHRSAASAGSRDMTSDASMHHGEPTLSVRRQ